ncbi:hypothetical protein GMO_26730 [Gluconobacter morbifer G707]|uniref:Uncharacterized protein n=1 Tax=Gluconobacter morbifer G707 TaxID=1088869 RepID=G6XMF5_9PROT|nr:hypothetical protein GMO_26730 [Gluconobacter morbifer G707]
MQATPALGSGNRDHDPLSSAVLKEPAKADHLPVRTDFSCKKGKSTCR